MKYHEFKVRVPVHPGVSVREWQWYIDSAVSSWMGGCNLNEEPYASMRQHLSRVKVTRILSKPKTQLRHVPPPMTFEEELFHIRNGTVVLNDEEKRMLREVFQQIDGGLPNPPRCTYTLPNGPRCILHEGHSGAHDVD